LKVRVPAAARNTLRRRRHGEYAEGRASLPQQRQSARGTMRHRVSPAEGRKGRGRRKRKRRLKPAPPRPTGTQKDRLWWKEYASAKQKGEEQV